MTSYIVDIRTGGQFAKDTFATLEGAALWLEAHAPDGRIGDFTAEKLEEHMRASGFYRVAYLPMNVSLSIERVNEDGRPIAALRLEIADKALAVVAVEGDLESREITNWARAEASENREGEVVDLLANLRHWCDEQGLDFGELDERARNHHFRETDPDAEGVKSVDYADIVRLRNRGLGITRVGKKWARQYSDGTVGPIHHDTVDAAWLDLKQTVDLLDRIKAEA